MGEKIQQLCTVAPLTLAPSLENKSAVAFPMPDEAPVTRATLPSSLPVILSLKKLVVRCGDDDVVEEELRRRLRREKNRLPQQCRYIISKDCLQMVAQDGVE